MADNDKKPIAHLLPAIFTGLAALIAALTGVYVNLRDDKTAPEPARTSAAAPSTPLAEALPVPPQRKAEKFRLQLDRIAVQHDGTVGTTDWRFAVEANGQPLFVFQQDDLDDTGGRNVATPKDVGAVLRLLPAQANRITIKGWRGSRFRLSPGDAGRLGRRHDERYRRRGADRGQGAAGRRRRVRVLFLRHARMRRGRATACRNTRLRLAALK